MRCGQISVKNVLDNNQTSGLPDTMVMNPWLPANCRSTKNPREHVRSYVVKSNDATRSHQFQTHFVVHVIVLLVSVNECKIKRASLAFIQQPLYNTIHTTESHEGFFEFDVAIIIHSFCQKQQQTDYKPNHSLLKS